MFCLGGSLLKQRPDFLTLICSVETTGFAEVPKTRQLGEAVRQIVDAIWRLDE